jgi:hypothetical protein
MQKHYLLLKEYLGPGANNSNRGASSAMARVGRLPAVQFYEVSSDLHDELRRRLENSDCMTAALT